MAEMAAWQFTVIPDNHQTTRGLIMCIIIEKKQGFTISSEWHKEFFRGNSDGFGLVHWPDGIGRPPKVKRSLSLGRAEQHLQSVGEAPAIVHYRMATHGETCKAMTHPFQIAEGVYFIHNGIMDAPDHLDTTYSDTAAFAELVLQPLLDVVPHGKRPTFIRSGAFRFLLERHLGHGNRAVICDSNGWVTYNNALWHTLPNDEHAGGLGGIRLSNTYAWANPYKPPVNKQLIKNRTASWSWQPVPRSTSSNVAVIDSHDKYNQEFPLWGGVELTKAEAQSLSYDELLEWVEASPLEVASLMYDLLGENPSYF